MDKIELIPQGGHCYTTKSMDETNSVSHNELMRIISSVKN